MSLMVLGNAYGDEICVLQGGNNNTYCHDSPLNYLDWGACAEDASGFARFVRHMVHLRCCLTMPLYPISRSCYYCWVDSLIPVLHAAWAWPRHVKEMQCGLGQWQACHQSTQTMAGV